MRRAVAIREPGVVKRKRTAPTAAPEKDEMMAELVALTVLAVNRLAPATLRSATFGTARKVVVPDSQVGAVFRAALEQMGEQRRTDRLIEIVVEGSAGSGSA